MQQHVLGLLSKLLVSIHPNPLCPSIFWTYPTNGGVRYTHINEKPRQRDVPERCDDEGGHGGGGGGPGRSNKAQLRRGSGRHGAQEHDQLRRKVRRMYI